MSLSSIETKEIGFVHERKWCMKSFFMGVGSVLLGIVIGIITLCCMIVGIGYWDDLYQFKSWINKNILNK
jgi:hypothetical protein